MTSSALSEWVLIVSGVLASASILLTVVYWAAKPVLQRWINDEMNRQLAVSLGPVQLELVTMNGELARVRIIEQKLENGMTMRLSRVEDDLNAIRAHLLGWDGDERRKP